MADGESKESTSKTNPFEELSFLVWGPNIKEEVFKRWTQGFVFSSDEPSALIQEQGGPCAVIASVQAYILKNVLFCDGMIPPSTSNWRQITEPTEYHKVVCNQELHLQTSREIHSLLSHVECKTVSEARSLIEKNFHIFEGLFGVLLFLYSMILTRGIELIKSEMSDPGEPLVDENFGYGSQTLINLLMTGKAVSNVWNLSKAVGGLELKGIPKQSEIGFLTILEAHRYCEVGSFLKCPIYPIWLLGSETHITVLFCVDQSLTGIESPKEEAERVFKSFDEQENGFIKSDKLLEVMEKLGFETDPEYVKFMKTRLDPDSIDVILLPHFMDEFFPGESNQSQWTNPFAVYHYNGLGIKSSTSPSKKVMFIEGMASIEPTDTSYIAEEEIVTCLRTKWSGITVAWQSRFPPSLN
ncbi:ubiquitin carboxyl-terminal hydrolase MINDY-3 homolog [Exaiptasia diaphana]|uniref:Ubiquitin carboxyl-terminal hydrolase MINDY n=1 Tax=Exaiptasia diaphana TaxID=2652724 RepID=A0A913XEY2_EXADI|nr:ubiquitin carboxyl-terminal hydrolase MINDY-3 homolog [Exaiptasia diaphana]KXJ12642.1 Protein FAM188A [Exaiptasia diaphana]